MEKITNEQLWDLADGLFSDAQRIEMEEKIKQNSELKRRFDTILAEKRLFSISLMEKPKSDFAAQLLQNWQEEQTSVSTANYTLLKVVFAVFLLLSVVLSGFLFFSQSVSEPIQVNLPTFELPWKSISLSITILGALTTVAFVEKLLEYRFYRNFAE